MKQVTIQYIIVLAYKEIHGGMPVAAARNLISRLLLASAEKEVLLTTNAKTAINFAAISPWHAFLHAVVKLCVEKTLI